jgi:hypothetical protein
VEPTDFWVAVELLILTYAALAAYFVSMDVYIRVNSQALFERWQQAHPDGKPAPAPSEG